VIAHTRTHGLFPLYSARITLHQAHLAHALGQTDRALKCYRVAAYLSQERDALATTGSATTPSPQSKADSNSRTPPTQEPDTEHDGCADRWVHVSARAGALWLRVGLAGEDPDEAGYARAMTALRREGADVVRACAGLGGTLAAVGAVLDACLATEFLAAKYVSPNLLTLRSSADP
jgi:hypothetical protein